MAGLFGGTIFTASRITTPNMLIYIKSIEHWIDVAKQMKVEAMVQNHPIFDATPERLSKLKARKAGEPHPYLISTENYGKFWQIHSECMAADVARR